MSDEIKIPMLNDEAQAALARKFDAEAQAAQAEAEYNRALIATEAENTRKAAAEARNAIAMETKQALINERHIETILGEDEYRRVYQFRGAVHGGSVDKALISLNAWHRADPTQEWEIHLFTPGGDMYAGMRFLDYLSIFKQTHKITTVSMGATMSMGSILLQGGSWRRMGKESTVLIHKGSMTGWIDSDVDDIFDQMEFIKKRHERVIKIFVDRAAQSAAKNPVKAEYIREKWERKDWYLDSDECLELGIVDEVL